MTWRPERARSRRALALAAVAGLAAAPLAPEPVRGQAPAASPSPSGPTPRVPVFTADVDVVAVDVNVVDGQGRPVRGLGVEDFTLTVDGAPRRVVSADFVTQGGEDPPGPVPSPDPDRTVSTNDGLRRGRIVVIVVDQGNIRPGVGRHALRAADRLLDALDPGDQVALVTMPGGGPQVELTTEHARVRNALPRISGRAQYAGQRLSLVEAQVVNDTRAGEREGIVNRFCPPSMAPQERDICVSDIEGEAFSVVSSFNHQSEVSMKGLAALMVALQQIEGPKTVVLITEGLRSQRTDELRDVANAAAAARVAFFGVHIDERGMPDVSRREPPTTALQDFDVVNRDLFRLASLTRGAVFTTTGGAGPFERIAREISSYYLLGFEPLPADRDGKDHTIEVRVARPGATVRARRALPLSGPRLDQREVLAQTLRSPLPAVELPLRVTSYASRDRATGKVRVLVSAEVGGGALPAGLGIAFALLDEKGKVAASSYQKVAEDAPVTAGARVSYLGSAAVDPGRYVLKLAAMDARGRRGSVEHPVRAALTGIGPLQASDLILAPPADKPGVSLRPGVDEAMDAGAMVGLLELHGPDGELRSAAVSLEVAKDETSPTLVSAPARITESVEGQRSVQGAVSLGLVPAGRYVARAVVSVGGRRLGQVTRPVVVAPTRGAALPAFRMPLSAVRFDKRLVLGPQVVAEALEAVAGLGPPSPSVSRAAAEARQGRLDRLGDLLSAGEAPSAGLAFLRGLGLFARGETVAAADQFRSALRLRADFIPALLYLGASSAMLGRDQDAVGAWNTAQLHDARSPTLSLLLADALVRRGELEGALETLKEAAAAWPSDDRFRQRLGLVHASAGRLEDALPLLEAHLAAHAEDTDTLFATVRLLYEQAATARGDRERLLRHARAYLAAGGPEQALVAEWIRSVEASRQ